MRRTFGLTTTSVPCPVCRDHTLLVRRFCQRTTLECAACERGFTLAELATLLDEATFSAVAEAVGDRLSDRV